MSWPMPATGQWNPNVTAVPQMNPASNVGSYTQDQWTAMQQQNWQQWAIWQQQYAQWQMQYRDKYAQMQCMQGMPPGSVGGMGGIGGMGFAAPFIPMSTSVPPVPPSPENPPPPPPPYENDLPLYEQPQSSVTAPIPVSNNTIQQNKNSGSNNNNDDNQSSQLSQNMDNTYAQPVSASNTAELQKLDEEVRLFDSHFKKWEGEIEKWKKENSNHPDKQAFKEHQDKFEACRAKLLERRKQMCKKRAKLLGNTPPASNLPNPSNVIKGKSLNADQYNNSPANQSQNSNPYFLASTKSKGGIPGLDIVQPDKNRPSVYKSDVIDITEDDTDMNSARAADYSKISNGITNILSDGNIMNVLSMVSQSNQEPSNQRSNGIKDNQWNNQRDSNNMYSNDQNDNRSMNRQKPMNKQYQQQGHGPMSQNFNQYSSQNQGPGIQCPPSLFSVPILPPPNFGLQSYGAQNFGPQRSDQFQNQGSRSQSHGPYGSGIRGSGGNLVQNQPNKFNYQNEDYASQKQQGFGQQQYNVLPPMQGWGPLPVQATGQLSTQVLDPSPSIDYNRIEAEMQRRPQNAQLRDRNTQYMNNTNMRINTSQNPLQNYSNEPPKSKWVEQPFFTPSIIVEYEHEPLRMEAPEFIEPLHTLDYNHTFNYQDEKTFDYRLEDDRTLIMRRTKRTYYEELVFERPNSYLHHQPPPQCFVRPPLRAPTVEEWSYGHDRNIPAIQRFESTFYEQTYDESTRREEYLDNTDSERRISPLNRRKDTRREDNIRDDYRNDNRSDDNINQNSISYNGSRKRSIFDNNMFSPDSKKSKDEIGDKGGNERRTHTVMIEDILDMPGRELRPEKIVIILRGLPGSGKSYLAKLIRDKEAEYGVTARIMSIDDYFIQEIEVEDTDPYTGKIEKKIEIKYVYEPHLEETYLNSLKRAFKRTLSEKFYSFIIYDAINDTAQSYGDVWNFSSQIGFQVYVCTMEVDVETCFKRNIHNRSLDEISVICSRFRPTPKHHTVLNATTLLNAAIPEEQMEDVDYDDIIKDTQKPEIVSTKPAIYYDPLNSSWKAFHED